jgi:hypothetical protein
VLRKLYAVLTGAEASHLGEVERRAILEILRQTKPDLPDYLRRLTAGANTTSRLGFPGTLRRS